MKSIGVPKNAIADVRIACHRDVSHGVFPDTLLGDVIVQARTEALAVKDGGQSDVDDGIHWYDSVVIRGVICCVTFLDVDAEGCCLPICLPNDRTAGYLLDADACHADESEGVWGCRS